MNKEVEPIHIGEVEDIDKGGVENFEHDEKDYAIFHLESGFFSTEGIACSTGAVGCSLVVSAVS